MNSWSFARAVGNFVAQIVAPSGCAACEAPVARGKVFCQGCAESVVRCEPPVVEMAFGRVFSPFLYGGELAVAISRFKYQGARHLAGPLGGLLEGAIGELATQIDTVVPVPLHPRRLRSRGYNQSALLAGRIARAGRCHFSPRALVRTVDTAAQQQLDRAGRAANVAGVFAARRGGELEGKRVLIVDDVMTTGATLGGCVEAAFCGGGREVVCLTLARAELL